MVGTHHLGQDAGGDDLVLYPVGHQEIVDAPPRVVLAGLEAVAPPAVGPGEVGVQVAEAVGEAGVQQPGELFPFLVGKTRTAPVGPGFLEYT